MKRSAIIKPIVTESISVPLTIISVDEGDSPEFEFPDPPPDCVACVIRDALAPDREPVVDIPVGTTCVGH